MAEQPVGQKNDQFIRCEYHCAKCEREKVPGARGSSRLHVRDSEVLAETAQRHSIWARGRCLPGCELTYIPPKAKLGVTP
jgi:hypothetical protein